MVAAYNILMLCDTWAIKRWYFKKNYTLEKYTAYCQEIALNGVGVAAGRRPGRNQLNQKHLGGFSAIIFLC